MAKVSQIPVIRYKHHEKSYRRWKFNALNRMLFYFCVKYANSF